MKCSAAITSAHSGVVTCVCTLLPGHVHMHRPPGRRRIERMKLRLICIGLMVCIGLLAWSALTMGETTRYALRISTETEGDRLKVVPYIEASDAAALRYEVISRKEGPSGT